MYFFKQDGLPYWFHPVEEVKGMMNDVMDIMGMVKDEMLHYNKDPNANFSESDITDGFNICVSTFVSMCLLQGFKRLKLSTFISKTIFTVVIFLY